VRKRSKAAVMIQLAHAGRKASSHTPWDGGQLIPVPKAAGGGGALRRSRTRRARRRRWRSKPAGLKRVRDAFVAAAKRAERLGIDAIEVHSAHGYLLAPVPVADRQPAHRSVWR
jgi:NADPH2 dehydrogenase